MSPQPPIDGPLLRIRGLSLRFGGVVALDDVSFDVDKNRILGLIGPNGAGKTTLFNCLSRLYEPHAGTIELLGRSLLALPRHAVARLGIGRTFQNLALFQTMSVRENILAGAHCRSRSGFLSDALRLPRVRREEARVRGEAERLIELLDLAAVADTPVGALTYAVKKRVELARALACEPTLLLLDEPAGGLNHDEVDRLGDLIRRIRDRLELTILLVEHHLNLVMRISDRVVALDFGRTIAEGTPAEMQRHPEVIRAYLGAST
jgi:branched-chain amino acid transport system ATP-binding protein